LREGVVILGGRTLENTLQGLGCIIDDVRHADVVEKAAANCASTSFPPADETWCKRPACERAKSKTPCRIPSILSPSNAVFLRSSSDELNSWSASNTGPVRTPDGDSTASAGGASAPAGTVVITRKSSSTW
jgi:hypothetical protein